MTKNNWIRPGDRVTSDITGRSFDQIWTIVSRGDTYVILQRAISAITVDRIRASIDDDLFVNYHPYEDGACFFWSDLKDERKHMEAKYELIDQLLTSTKWLHRGDLVCNGPTPGYRWQITQTETDFVVVEQGTDYNSSTQRMTYSQLLEKFEPYDPEFGISWAELKNERQPEDNSFGNLLNIIASMRTRIDTLERILEHNNIRDRS